MKILFITQAVDKDNPALGFFHRWLNAFAKEWEQISVVCLEKGKFDLPRNVSVFSLGKERFKIQDSRFKSGKKFSYAWRFLRYIARNRNEYDAVFVHMNQEYVLLAGWLWRLFGKRVTMWRNHYAGSFLTDIAVAFCHKIFYTSSFSYTEKFKKAVQMPVGIDTDFFRPVAGVNCVPHSILFCGRIALSKRPHLLLEVLRILKERGKEFTASFYGNYLPSDESYYHSLQKKVSDYGLSDRVKFHKGVPNDEMPLIFSSHEISVNLSPSGMYDKTIFEAAACGSLSLSSNENLKEKVSPQLLFREGSMEDLAEKLGILLSMKEEEKKQLVLLTRSFVESHSLLALSKKLYREIPHRQGLWGKTDPQV